MHSVHSGIPYGADFFEIWKCSYSREVRSNGAPRRGIRTPKYRKIPKISPGAYSFQRPCLRGLVLEGLMYGEIANSWKEIYRLALFYFVFEGKFQVQAPGGLYLEGRFNGGFLRYEFGGLIFRGVYFRNSTVVSRDRPWLRMHRLPIRDDWGRVRSYALLLSVSFLIRAVDTFSSFINLAGKHCNTKPIFSVKYFIG